MKTIHHPQHERLIDSLIHARKAQQLTQVQSAEKLGKPQSFIAKIEGRERKLDIVELMQLCEILNIDPLFLLSKVFSLKN